MLEKLAEKGLGVHVKKCAIVGFLLLSVEAFANQSFDELSSKADIVIKESLSDNVSAAKEVEHIFIAAEECEKKQDSEKSLYYYKKGLQLAPWELHHQLAYAKLLSKSGRREEAVGNAGLVYSLAEQDAIIEGACEILEKDFDKKLPVLPVRIDPKSSKVICLVPVGQPSQFLMHAMGNQLSEKMGTPIYRYPRSISIWESDRSYLDMHLKMLKKNIQWDHPGVVNYLNFIKVKDHKEMTQKQFLKFLVLADESNGNRDAEKEWDAAVEDLKKRSPQWDAQRMLNNMWSRIKTKNPNVIYIGVTDKDIYSGSSNFVFGSALTGQQLSLISYHRYTACFNEERDNRERLLSRIHKQLLASLGHCVGLLRPTDPRAARSYPNSLHDHDNKGEWLTLECIEGFEKKMNLTIPESTKLQTRKALGL